MERQNGQKLNQINKSDKLIKKRILFEHIKQKRNNQT